MVKWINAVAPGIGPVICRKLFLNLSRRISASDIDDAPVQENRVSAIGNYTVVPEDSSIWLFHVVSFR
jgi:hypothetical protein